MRDFTQAISYCRTSTSTNADGDSEPRQRQAIEAYAKRAGISFIQHHYDVITGASDVEARPAFDRVLKALKASNIGCVIVESIDRFARESLAGQMGIALLRQMGVRLIAASDGRDHCGTGASDAFMTSIMLAVAQFEKSRVVERLRHGRQARIAATGWAGGWKNPAEHATAAKAMRKAGMSLREIAHSLADVGMLNHRARRYSAQSVADMLA